MCYVCVASGQGSDTSLHYPEESEPQDLDPTQMFRWKNFISTNIKDLQNYKRTNIEELRKG